MCTSLLKIQRNCLALKKKIFIRIKTEGDDKAFVCVCVCVAI